MACSNLSTKRRRSGLILSEWIIAVAISSLLFAAVAGLAVFGARSFATIQNYVDMGQQTRLAMDRISKEIRSADKLISYSPNQLIFLVGTNQVTFQYSASAKTLVRKLDGAQTDLLLSPCDFVQFDIYQNNAANASFEALTAATTNNCKIVQMSWQLSRGILGTRANTEDCQSARIVMRKQ